MRSEYDLGEITYIPVPRQHYKEKSDDETKSE